jgi:uncharacterized membrane protein
VTHLTLIWLLCALAPGLFHALSNLVDQYVIREHTSGSPFLFLAFSGFVCFPIAVMIYPFIPAADPLIWTQGLWIIMCAWLFSACCVPYVYAMEHADAHEFTPVFQTSPVFVAIFGWVWFGETLTIWQIIGGITVIAAAAASMMNWRHFHFKAYPFFLIVLAMIFYAGFVIALRAIAPDLSWVTVTFWLCIGWTLLPIIMFIIAPPIRRAMMEKIIQTRGRILGYSATQEIADVAANTARTAALGFAAVPAAVTDLMGSLQVIFALVFSYIAARLIPSIYTFDLAPYEIIHKLLCFGIMVAGLWVVIMPV